MAHPIPLKRIADFFIVKIITGIIVVGGTVALIEYLRQLLPPNIQTANAPNIIFGVVEAFMAVLIYFLFFRFYERRQITELSIKALRKNVLAGFFTGLILQSLAILILFLAGDYSVIYINPVSFLIPGFIAAFIAGF